ncbi:MAG TPA: ATPase, partial [Phycicoccus sp.]|nr:ATPase [Phycicoccus sp.]
MNIVFVEPAFPANQRRFALALAAVGANVYGVSETDEWGMDEELRSALKGHYRVNSVTNVRELTEATRYF